MMDFLFWSIVAFVATLTCFMIYEVFAAHALLSLGFRLGIPIMRHREELQTRLSTFEKRMTYKTHSARFRIVDDNTCFFIYRSFWLLTYPLKGIITLRNDRILLRVLAPLGFNLWMSLCGIIMLVCIACGTMALDVYAVFGMLICVASLSVSLVIYPLLFRSRLLRAYGEVKTCLERGKTGEY
jgi:hypothetical protein